MKNDILINNSYMTKDTLMCIISRIINNDLVYQNSTFNHKEWSLRDAEILEDLARLIRYGYNEGLNVTMEEK